MRETIEVICTYQLVYDPKVEGSRDDAVKLACQLPGEAFSGGVTAKLIGKPKVFTPTE